MTTTYFLLETIYHLAVPLMTLRKELESFVREPERCKNSYNNNDLLLAQICSIIVVVFVFSVS